MRLAQEAQVIPVMARSTCWVGASSTVLMASHLPGRDVEARGVDLPAVAEVQEQTVAAGAGHLRGELDVRTRRLGLVRVHVQVGQVAVAQGHEVAVGAEVGLEVGDRPPVARHRQGQLGVAAADEVAGELHGVAVHLGGATVGRQRLGGGHLARDGQVGAQRQRGTTGRR